MHMLTHRLFFNLQGVLWGQDYLIRMKSTTIKIAYRGVYSAFSRLKHSVTKLHPNPTEVIFQCNQFLNHD